MDKSEKLPATIGAMRENYSKNRFADILPCMLISNYAYLQQERKVTPLLLIRNEICIRILPGLKNAWDQVDGWPRSTGIGGLSGRVTPQAPEKIPNFSQPMKMPNFTQLFQK